MIECVSLLVCAEDIEPEGDEEEDEKQPDTPSAKLSKTYSAFGFVHMKLIIKCNVCRPIPMGLDHCNHVYRLSLSLFLKVMPSASENSIRLTTL